MIHAWHRSVATTLLCDRLHDPDWTGRIKVCGQPPQALPEWGQRPVVLTFLHTGGYVILRYWLRSQGVAATTYVSGIPAILKTWQARRTFAAADGRYDLHGVPHFFYAPADLRRARDSLTPGRVLLMALDGGCATLSDEYALVGGQSIRLTNGAARTAAAAGAVLVGAAVRLTKDDCFRIHFTSPVPDEILRNGDPRTANRVLLDQLWPEIAAHPEVLGWSTLEAFFPDPAGPYLHWP
jgi:lauroyl/myristoyl acyltransferase